MVMANPIIGPPDIIFATPGDTVTTSEIKSLTRVPTGTLIFFGVSQAPPEIVKPLSIKGLPSLKASEIAQNVPTLLIIQPISAGNPPAGISRPKAETVMHRKKPRNYPKCLG